MRAFIDSHVAALYRVLCNLRRDSNRSDCSVSHVSSQHVDFFDDDEGLLLKGIPQQKLARPSSVDSFAQEANEVSQDYDLQEHLDVFHPDPSSPRLFESRRLRPAAAFPDLRKRELERRLRSGCSHS